jgi:hypothetical protein
MTLGRVIWNATLGPARVSAWISLSWSVRIWRRGYRSEIWSGAVAAVVRPATDLPALINSRAHSGAWWYVRISKLSVWTAWILVITRAGVPGSISRVWIVHWMILIVTEYINQRRPRASSIHLLVVQAMPRILALS